MKKKGILLGVMAATLLTSAVVSYNDTKYKDVNGGDVKTHSVNLGVTYHF